MYIDTHAHLMDERFDAERERLLSTLKEQQLDFIINIGYDADSSLKSVQYATDYENVYSAIAFHPHDSKNFTKADYQNFLDLSKNPKVVAIGETGLDYHYDLSPRDVQKKVFCEHLQLAKETSLPVIIHLRDAYEDMLDILKQNKNLIENNGALLHCYSGSAEMAKEYLKLGMYISFGGAITFKNAKGLLDSVKAVPLDRIMTETDCPYLTPEPHRGQLNYPEYVKFVAKKIAELKETNEEVITDAVHRNCKAFFKRIK